jgi:hypothetical protein
MHQASKYETSLASAYLLFNILDFSLPSNAKHLSVFWLIEGCVRRQPVVATMIVEKKVNHVTKELRASGASSIIKYIYYLQVTSYL